MMENSSQSETAPRWFSGLLGRKLAPGVLRHQVEQYDSLGVMASTRGGCAIFSGVLGLCNLLLGVFVLVYAITEAEPMGGWRSLLELPEFVALITFGILFLGIGILSLSLTVPVKRGNANALRVIAAAWAVSVFATGCMWLLVHGTSWQAAAGTLFLIAGYLIISRAFTAALRVERERRTLVQGG